MATIVVFESNEERAMMCANVCHDWENQKDIFGKETKKLLDACYNLFHASIRKKGDEAKLLKKIFGIAKSHGVYITWYGMSSSCEPDRFLVSGHGFERLALIQC